MLYFIYELVNSITGIPGYVGITNNPNLRHKQHLTLDSNDKKIAWIQKTVSEGAEVKMNVLEVVDGEAKAREREKYWIRYYIEEGILLTNIRGNEDSFAIIFDNQPFYTISEARWAVFYTHAGIPYEYKTKGYKISGKWYIPSFWLPEQDCFVDVHEEYPSSEKIEKIDIFHIFSGKITYLFYGNNWTTDRFVGVGVRSGSCLVVGYCADVWEMIDRRDRRKQLIEEHEKEHGKADSNTIDEISERRDTRYSEYVNVPPHILLLFYTLAKYEVSLILSLPEEEEEEKLNVNEVDLKIKAPINISTELLLQVQHLEKELASILARHGTWEWSLCKYPLKRREQHWCECPKCHLLGIAFKGKPCALKCECIGYGNEEFDLSTLDTPRMIEAYAAARQARF